MQQAAGMNLQQIAQGDYSIIVGTWKSNVNNAAVVMTAHTFFENGEARSLTMSATSAPPASGFPVVDGFMVTFVPAGVVAPVAQKDLSNQAVDRLLMGQNTSKDGSEAFYRVNN
jgi:hypothetical protein